MFYFTPEGWKPFKKVITYTEKITAYDDTDEPYLDKTGMMSADIDFGDEELKRLDIIKHIGSMSVEAVYDYVFNNQVIDDNLVELKAEVKAEEQRQKLTKFIRWDELTTEEMLDLVDDFKPYEVGAYYIPDNIFNYNGQLYKVLPNSENKGHTALENWKPDTTPALYLPIAPPEVISEWVQPFGGSGTYVLGAKVLYKGKVYENILTGKLNVWSPEGLPSGWKEILD